LDLKEIKQIISLMTRSELTEFEIEDKGFKLRICRASSSPQFVTSVAHAPVAHTGHGNPHPAPTHAAVPHAPAGSEAPADEPGIIYIKSPMVGTFYRAPSPESPAFVELNSKVAEESPVCIIEAMKIMNEIQAEVRGTVLEALVEDGQPVEFGQRLFKVKAD
jgi:acetyl-CoA carboxylase biotin carboxyl carrier protein